MSAFVLFIKERAKDQNEIEEYRKLVPAAMAGWDVKPLAVYGKSETLEGPESQGVVLLEFPTYEEAVGWSARNTGTQERIAFSARITG